MGSITPNTESLRKESRLWDIATGWVDDPLADSMTSHNMRVPKHISWDQYLAQWKKDHHNEPRET